MGLGGGFLMTIWDAENKKADFLDAREAAPLAATEDMFDGNADLAMRGRILFHTINHILQSVRVMHNSDIFECPRDV